jgi:muconolactone delta-isomerase
MDFLVYMEVTGRIDGGNEALAVLLEQEAERARILSAAGILLRLWRVPGRRANWGIWRATTADELHSAIASLPLFSYLAVTVHPLATHPNDPHLLLEPIE